MKPGEIISWHNLFENGVLLKWSSKKNINTQWSISNTDRIHNPQSYLIGTGEKIPSVSLILRIRWSQWHPPSISSPVRVEEPDSGCHQPATRNPPGQDFLADTKAYCLSMPPRKQFTLTFVKLTATCHCFAPWKPCLFDCGLPFCTPLKRIRTCYRETLFGL